MTETNQPFSGQKQAIFGPKGELVRRYARALYEMARDDGALEDIQAQAAVLLGAIHQSDDFQYFLSFPRIASSERERALAAVAEKISAHQIFTNFLRLVARQRRTPILADILQSFHNTCAEKQGHHVAQVVAAAPLSDEQQKKLQQLIQAHTGKHVQLCTEIRPSLLGGLQVRLGSLFIDSSVDGRLQRMARALKEAA